MSCWDFLRQKYNSIAVILLFVGAVLNSITLLYANAEDSFSDIGHIYYVQAQKIYDADKFDEAQRFLDIAMEFNDDYSDLYFLQAQIALKKQNRYNAIYNLRKALDINVWHYNKVHIASRQLIRFLYETMDYKILLNFIQKMTNLDINIFDDPQNLQYYIAALFEQKKNFLAIDILKQALDIYPEYPPLFELIIDYHGVPSFFDFLWFEKYKTDSSQYLSLLEKYIQNLGNNKTRNKWLQVYWNLGGRNPDMIYYELQADDNPDYNQYIERFVTLGGLQLLDAFQHLYALLPAQYQSELLQKLPEYVTMYRDKNQDTLFEENYQYINGKLMQWNIDDNQDGILNYKIFFKDDSPSAVQVTQDNVTVEYYYYIYPYISHITVFEKKNIKEYQFMYDRIQLPIIMLESQSIDKLADNSALPQYLLLMNLNKNFPLIDYSLAYIVNYYYYDSNNTVTTENAHLVIDSSVTTSDTIAHGEYGQDYSYSKKLLFRQESWRDQELTLLKEDRNLDGSIELVKFFNNNQLQYVVQRSDYEADFILVEHYNADAQSESSSQFDTDTDTDAVTVEILSLQDASNQDLIRYLSFLDQAFF